MPKKALRARRAPQTVRWTVCSQSGEQFIIATRGFSPGHSRGSSHRCLFASFSALEKEDIHLKPLTPGEVAAPADGESENYSRRKPKTITSAYFSPKPTYRISSFTKNSTTPRRLVKTLRTPRLKPCRRIRKGIRYFLPF